MNLTCRYLVVTEISEDIEFAFCIRLEIRPAYITKNARDWS